MSHSPEPTDKDLLRLGRALFHVLSHPGEAFDLELWALQNPAKRQRFSVIAVRKDREEVGSNDGH